MCVTNEATICLQYTYAALICARVPCVSICALANNSIVLCCTQTHKRACAHTRFYKRMNLSLRDVVCTSRDGDKFWKIPECYIRGNNIKYLRVPDEVIDKVVEEPKSMCPPHTLLPD